MTITELGAIGEFVSSIVVMLTLVYVAVQVRQNTAQQKREETISIQRGQNDVVSHLLDPAMVRAYARAADGEIRASAEDRSRAIIWVVQYLNHFQIVYDLHHGGTLDKERYELWKGFAISMVASTGIRERWETEQGKLAFMPDIRALIDRKLNDPAEPPIPFNEMWSIFNANAWKPGDSEF
jgi:hypothetical protein